MGACIVTGLNNWDRVHQRKAAWREENPDAPDTAWSAEFKTMVPQKHLYQDRFIILSSGYYSGVPAENAGIPADVWKEQSIAVRGEHESVHYFTYRILGAMRNNLLDETIADYAALVSVFGHYKAELARHFFGLETYPEYRPGGRLENYLGDPPLGEAAFKVLQNVVDKAIANLGAFDEDETQRAEGRRPLASIVIAIGSMTLDELALEDISERVAMVCEALQEPSPDVRFTIKNDDDGMGTVMDTFSAFAKDFGLAPRLVATMNMAIDELVSNIIKYGFDDDAEHDIEVRYAIESGEFVTELVDDGLAFNMLEKEDPDLELSIDEKPIGGLGVYLVKQLTDSQTYERRDDKNHLSLRKKIDQDA